ncbi:acetoacetate--CoA ligase [Ferroplasma sp.]|uniref:acetoacetate--CoA ligase n=1 Tax=Ferroplasma sp. TaxID=2591003 RepID=UPI00307E053D
MNSARKLWAPDLEYAEESSMQKFIAHVKKNTDKNINNYSELWEWSVNNLQNFWTILADFYHISLENYKIELTGENVNARWFEGAKLNYAEYVYKSRNNDKIAIISYNEEGKTQELSYRELWSKVSSFSRYLINNGIGYGDRVCAYTGNIPEAIIAFLATASIGAIWSSCSPDFGIKGVIERFSQIAPKAFIVSPEYSYNGKKYERSANALEILKALPSVKVAITTGDVHINGFVLMNEIHEGKEFEPVKVGFSDPIWILYSSGTTGKPKAIVHGHGGILLEHFKVLGLHMNISEKSVFAWATTTGWMMWNVQVSGLLMGSTLVLYDGSLYYPDSGILWKLVEKYRITHLGVGAAYLEYLMQNHADIKNIYDLTALEFIGSTGSPLSSEAFEFVYKYIKKKVWLSSLSGGTDICSAICLGSPTLPVYSGMIQCRGLGAHVEALDINGNPVINQKGELAIMDPMPNMPLFFWNDDGKKRYYDSYYTFYPGIWRHGDFISIDSSGRVIIYGRSDAVLNRNGIRIGTGEIYSSIENIEWIKDSLTIGYLDSKKIYRIAIFITLKDNIELSDDMVNNIKNRIRQDLSPRHIPDYILKAPDIPYTLNGKKLEVPVTRIIEGQEINMIINRDSVKNPECLEYYISVRTNIY